MKQLIRLLKLFSSSILNPLVGEVVGYNKTITCIFFFLDFVDAFLCGMVIIALYENITPGYVSF